MAESELDVVVDFRVSTTDRDLKQPLRGYRIGKPQYQFLIFPAGLPGIGVYLLERDFCNCHYDSFLCQNSHPTNDEPASW